jgi:hypothetical protein
MNDIDIQLYHHATRWCDNVTINAEDLPFVQAEAAAAGVQATILEPLS